MKGKEGYVIFYPDDQKYFKNVNISQMTVGPKAFVHKVEYSKTDGVPSGTLEIWAKIGIRCIGPLFPNETSVFKTKFEATKALDAMLRAGLEKVEISIAELEGTRREYIKAMANNMSI